MNIIKIDNPSHPFHEQVLPVISAYKKGFVRLANTRFMNIIEMNNVKQWEMMILINIVKSKIHGHSF